MSHARKIFLWYITYEAVTTIGLVIAGWWDGISCFEIYNDQSGVQFMLRWVFS